MTHQIENINTEIGFFKKKRILEVEIIVVKWKIL